jgi:PAS domain-containing protein
VSSSTGILLYANPSYELILGYNHSELIGKKAADLYLDPEERRSWESHMKVSGVVRNVETRLKRKDGTPIWVSINVSPIIYGGMQAVMNDSGYHRAKGSGGSAQSVATNLETANKVGIAGYSVSRFEAPLRGIDGFSDALLEDCEAQR